MRRREFIATLAGAAWALPQRPFAQTPPQTPKLVRVGILFGGSGSLSNPTYASYRDAFLQGLRQRGWEGKKLIIEERATEGRAERFAEHAAELVASQVDVAVGTDSQAIQALKEKTSTIPIVMVGAADPIGSGFIASLARPGGNITGVTNQFDEIAGKHFELLREFKPGIERVGVLYTPSNSSSAIGMKQFVDDMRKWLGGSLVPVPIDKPEDIEAAFVAVDQNRLEALNVHPTPVIVTNRIRITALLIERGLLTITGSKALARDGILLSYGPDGLESWRGAAAYVDRILRGANPADLPVQLPTKFELVINLKTARALGLTIPPTLLARADEVIE